MKFAIISDVHGNLEALESVFRDIEKQGAEKIHFMGDAVGYGCNPNRCVEAINKFCDIKLLGNHDYAALGLETTESFNPAARDSMNWTRQNIKEDTITILSDFELDSNFLDFHLVHASPGSPDEWRYLLTLDSARSAFEEFAQSVCLVGHSHLPTCFIRDDQDNIDQRTRSSINLDKDNRYIINVGSVGQPRDNDPRACYLLVDTEAGTGAYRRVEYDIKITQEKMRDASLPTFLIDRLAMGV